MPSQLATWIKPFSSPVNGTDGRIDANAVRGNDNVLGAALNEVGYWVADVRRFGAKANFVAGGIYNDDTAAIQAGIDYLTSLGGGVLLVPPGRYWVTDTITLPTNADTPPESAWIGVSIQGKGANASRFVAYDPTSGAFLSDKAVVNVRGNNSNVFMRDFGIDGPNPGLCAAVTNEQMGGSPAGVRSIGLFFDSLKNSTMQNIDVTGCAVGIGITSCQGCTTFAIHARDNRDAGLWIASACETIVVYNSTYQVVNSSGDAGPGERPANVKITNNGFSAFPRNIYIAGVLLDEIGFNSLGGGASLDVQHGKDITLARAIIYSGGKQQVGGDPYYGIHIGAGASRVQIHDVRIEPFVVDDVRVPNATIQIDAGASGVALVDVSTDPNAGFGGIDIVDLAADTTYLNVNGHTRMRGDFKRSSQSLAFTGSLYVNAVLGDYVRIGALTGNITIEVTTNPALDQRLTFFFLQDATGGRTVTFTSSFITSWSDAGNTANRRSSISFVYDGTYWIQDGAQRPWA